METLTKQIFLISKSTRQLQTICMEVNPTIYTPKDPQSSHHTPIKYRIAQKKRKKVITLFDTKIWLNSYFLHIKRNICPFCLITLTKPWCLFLDKKYVCKKIIEMQKSTILGQFLRIEIIKRPTEGIINTP